MRRKTSILMVTAAAALAGCASLPEGPGVMALPGSSRSFDQFRGDDVSCQQYAMLQVGGTTPTQAQVSSGVGSAVAGAALGAAAGAVIGGGQGAAIGAGSGLVAGGLVGTSAASYAGRTIQERYDIHYIQCMYAQGHRVPVYGNFTADPPRGPAPTIVPPPPPPGSPPPPPPPPPPR